MEKILQFDEVRGKQSKESDDTCGTRARNLENILTELVDLNKANMSQGQTSQTPSNSTGVRLPKLELPKFNGDILQWNGFWDVFQHSVDKSQISKAEKMSYLKGCLTGSARDVLEGMPLDDANYDGAVQMLKEQFGKQECVANAHYKSLMEIPPAENNTTALRKLHTQIERHLRSLEAVGEDMNQKIFLSIVMAKLPETVIFNLEITRGNSTWNVHALCKALLRYVEAKETSTAHADSRLVTDSPRSIGGLPSYTHSSEEALLSHTAQRSPPRCFYCKDTHFTDECTKCVMLE
eukprot:scpid56885/ scgid22413/ 